MNLIKEKISHIIIDECCQAVEPEILIPFKFNPKKIILIGDP